MGLPKRTRSFHSHPHNPNKKTSTKEKLTPTNPDQGWTNQHAHRQHVQLLAKLVHKNLLHYNFVKASEGLSVLARKTDYVPEVMWQTGSAVLYHLTDAEDVHRKIVRFLTQMYSISRPERERIALEIFFAHVANGDYEEAYRYLSCLIPLEPYCNNGIVHGYVGLVACIQWMDNARKRSENLSSQQNSQSQAAWMNSQLEYNSKGIEEDARQQRRILGHVRKAFALGVREEALLCVEIRVLEYTQQFFAVEKLVELWLNELPNSPFVKRYWYFYVSMMMDGSDEGKERIRDALIAISEVDPTDHCLDDASELFDNGVLSPADMVMLICIRLDHAPYHGAIGMWEQLADILEKAGVEDNLYSSLDWESRRRWWPKLYYPEHGNEDEKTRLHMIRNRVFLAAENITRMKDETTLPHRTSSEA
eukprot:CFRG5444T1